MCVSIELVKALVPSECSRTLSQRNVNLCRCAHSQKCKRVRGIKKKKKKKPEELSVEVWFADLSCDLCFEN